MSDERDTVNGSPSPVPWTGGELLIGLFLVWGFWPGLASWALQFSGFYSWFYGTDLSGANPPLRDRMLLWASVLASPAQILTFPLIFGAMSGTRLDQLGLTRRRLGRNLLTGLLGWLVLTPVVLGLYQLVLYLYARGGAEVEKHALEIVAGQSPAPIEWVLLVLAAVVTAPVIEELTFRGVLQPWLAGRRWGGHLAMLLAFAVALLRRGDRLEEAWKHGMEALLAECMPAVFVLALVPIYLLVWWRSRTSAGPAIFGTALLFACVHAAVWPSPVPLFILGLGLGWLAQRSGSLAGPILWHALFNAIPCVQLLWHQG